MLPVVAAALALLTVPLLGGRLSGLERLELRWPGLPVLALVVQVVIISFVDLPDGIASAIHVATYVPLAVFFVANRRHAGAVLLTLGLAANAAAIAANGGVMPADADAQRRAGIEEGEGFDNSAVVEDARLRFLGDVFAWPEPMPLANVFSVGDVLVVLGVGALGHQAGASLLTREGRDRRRAVARSS